MAPRVFWLSLVVSAVCGPSMCQSASPDAPRRNVGLPSFEGSDLIVRRSTSIVSMSKRLLGNCVGGFSVLKERQISTWKYTLRNGEGARHGHDYLLVLSSHEDGSNNAIAHLGFPIEIHVGGRPKRHSKSMHSSWSSFCFFCEREIGWERFIFMLTK